MGNSLLACMALFLIYLSVSSVFAEILETPNGIRLKVDQTFTDDAAPISRATFAEQQNALKALQCRVFPLITGGLSATFEDYENPTVDTAVVKASLKCPTPSEVPFTTPFPMHCTPEAGWDTVTEDELCVKNVPKMASCGRNSDGALMTGDTASVFNSYVSQEGHFSGVTGFRKITAGYLNSCALSNDGELYCVGKNAYYNSGGPTTVDSILPYKVPFPGMAMQDVVVDMMSSYFHTVVRTAFGEHYSFGRCDYYQCLQGDVVTDILPTLVTSIPGPYKQMTISAHGTYFLMEDGRVWGSGYNGAASLNPGMGVGVSEIYFNMTEATGIPIDRLLDIPIHALGFVGTDGFVYSRGESPQGRCHNNTRGSVFYKTEQPELTNPLDVKCGTKGCVFMTQTYDLFLCTNDNEPMQEITAAINSHCTEAGTFDKMANSRNAEFIFYGTCAPNILVGKSMVAGTLVCDSSNAPFEGVIMTLPAGSVIEEAVVEFAVHARYTSA